MLGGSEDRPYLDFLGPDIDIGFRLSGHSHPGGLILSPNLAEAVSVRKRNYYSLENRSQIEVRFGVRNDTHDLNDFYTDPALSRSGLGDAFVSFGYNYFADERTAFSLSLKVLAAEEIDYLDFASPVAGLGSKVGFDATRPFPHTPNYDRARVMPTSLDGLDLVIPQVATTKQQ